MTPVRLELNISALKGLRPGQLVDGAVWAARASKSGVLETPVLSVCTTDLYGDLLRHQDVIDRNIQDDAECQHVVDAGKGVRRTAYRTKNTASSGQESGIILHMGIRMLLRIHRDSPCYGHNLLF